VKLRFLAACAALATLSAGAAIAADSVTAKLAAPVAAKTKFIAGGAMFHCEADTCVAVATSQTFALATCKAIAEKVGPVAAFSGRETMDERRLANCNAKTLAKTGGAATTLAKQ
jgi:hypothetical protein